MVHEHDAIGPQAVRQEDEKTLVRMLDVGLCIAIMYMRYSCGGAKIAE
jgi:hypothetical protein